MSYDKISPRYTSVEQAGMGQNGLVGSGRRQPRLRRRPLGRMRRKRMWTPPAGRNISEMAEGLARRRFRERQALVTGSQQRRAEVPVSMFPLTGMGAPPVPYYAQTWANVPRRGASGKALLGMGFFENEDNKRWALAIGIGALAGYLLSRKK